MSEVVNSLKSLTSICHLDVAILECACEIVRGPNVGLLIGSDRQIITRREASFSAGTEEAMSERQSGFAAWSGGPVLKRASLCFGAILASMALFSVMVSSASAKEQRGFFLAGEKSEEKAKQPRFEGEIYPTHLFGEGSTKHTFTTKIGAWSCSQAQFYGELTGATATQRLTQSYFSCIPPGAGTPFIRWNGCEFVTHVANAGPPYTGELEMSCPAGKVYELEVAYPGSTNCTIGIPSQTGLKGITFTNVGAGKTRGVEMVFNVSKLKYSLAGSAFFCKGEYEDGTYTGTATVNGFNEK